VHAAGIAFGIAGGIAFGVAVGVAGGIAFGSILGIAGGIGGGIALGIAFGIAVGVAGGIALGIVLGISGGIALGIAAGIALGIASRITSGIASGIAGGIAEGITEGIVAGIAFGVAVGVSFGIAFGIAWSVGSLRVYYHLAHLFFVWPRSRGHWYPYHPVAWDDLCVLPSPQLDLVLMAYAEQHPQAGEQEIERLIETYPAQRMAALRAKARLMARRAADEPLGRLDTAVADLPEGAEGFLRDTAKLRDMVGEIARLQHGLEGQDRPFLREPVAAQLAEKIENVRHRLGGLSEPLASEFRAAAQHWSARAHDQHAAIRHKLERSPAPLVFRAGDPVERCREAFVPRTRVVGQLDRQLTLATGCPALILYGRRRMGKSTVLRNLQGFLPDAVLVAQLSMQKAKAFSAQTSLLVQIAATVADALGDLGPDGHPSPEDTVAFYDYLEACDTGLRAADKRLLLALDEYEYIDRKLGEGVFDEDLLALIRESIQSHRNLTWIFAGNHDITELTHAEWTSYLVSARTIEVLPFTPEETRRLLTEPLRYSCLWDWDDANRPHFKPGFWGAGGIEWIHTEAGGWPHLVQLLAETVVDLFNDAETLERIDADLLERAADEAVMLGNVVLRQLMNPDEAAPAEWTYLSGFRAQDRQPPPTDETVRQALRRRLLVTEEGDRWRLRVPLMQRWLRQRG